MTYTPSGLKKNFKVNLNDDTFGFYKLDKIVNGEDDIKEYNFELTAKGSKKLDERIGKLKEYAEKCGYGATKWESVWLENYDVEDDYETEIVITTSESQGWKMPTDLDEIREETSVQDVNVVLASWTVMRQESYMHGSWFRINLKIPIVDLIYLHQDVIIRKLELGEYDNITH